MEDKNNLNVDLDNEEITDDIKKEMKESDTIHIHKTDNEGKEVDIDIDKNKKTVNVNVNKDNDGKKKNVKIGFSGIKVKDGEESVNIWLILHLTRYIVKLIAIRDKAANWLAVYFELPV